MTSINSLDLKEFITNAVREIFDTMLSMDMETVEEPSVANFNGSRIVGSIGFAGLVMGNLNLHVDEAFARRMTAAMLDMETDEIEGSEDIHDVIGELCNMICGDLKSRLCDEGLTCELSIPSITSGKEFTIEAQGWARSERYGFRSHQDTALVEIFMKSSN
ncbi:MAG: chemotaxis protein CheX [Desulfobacterales bacterium]|nr:MAG: chemotaxis protein CheX [Desulfobacterales bacterium]